MSKREQDQLLEHNYDGIQEYDNPLPRWWVYIFWATFIFGVAYIPYYHFGPGKLVHDEYEANMKAYYDQQAKEILALGEIDDAAIVKIAGNPGAMEGAKAIFQSKCATCHGMFGEGLIGPNLTDRYWIHGARPTDIHRTIRDGVLTKGMLAWGKILPPADVVKMAGYILTLRGTNPPNPKAPQGELVEEGEPSGEQATDGDSDSAAAPS